MWQRLSRSELLSTFFPIWIWQGRQWSKGRIPKNDPYFWINAHAHPVISSYYPYSLCLSYYVGRFERYFNLENFYNYAFVGLLFLLFSHIIFCFIGWYMLVSIFSSPLIAIFGAVTLTFSAYNWKQQPCFIYTIAWFPWLLTGIATHNILLTSCAFGMMLLAGYYPIGIQSTLIAAGASVLWGCSLIWIPIGLLIGSPQLIPFLKYLPKTIRTNKVSTIGKVPWWHPITLIFPLNLSLRGVGYWEMAYYVGIVPLVLAASSTSKIWILGVISYFLMIGVGSKFLPRIPARWCFSFQFAIGWMAVNGLAHLHLTERVLVCLIIIQTFDLIWHNAALIPTRPYSELYNKPSLAYNTALTRFLEKNLGDGRVSGLPYPLFTGHIHEFKTLGYSGGMQLKLMAKWRKDTNPDGSGGHDYFRSNIDDGPLKRYRVKYAFTRSKCDWERTAIKYLYKNPEYR